MAGAAPGLSDLARRLSGMAGERRVIVGLTGPPGVGKSWLAQRLVEALAGGENGRAVAVGLDGFHLASAELRRLGLADRKGAIETFDGDGFLALLGRLRADPDRPVYAPAFDRRLEEAIACGVAVGPATRIVVVEGNYLLDASSPWHAVAGLLDATWYLDVPPDLRRRRLAARHVAFGRTPAEARAWMASVDDPNATRIASGRSRADLVVDVTAV